MLLTDTGRSQKPNMDRLIADYGASLLRLCCLYLRDRAQAEDAVTAEEIDGFRNMLVAEALKRYVPMKPRIP